MLMVFVYCCVLFVFIVFFILGSNDIFGCYLIALFDCIIAGV